MRVVIDTNVLIAALVASGKSHRVVEHCFVNHQVVSSPFILDELQEKLVSKFKQSRDSAAQAIELFRTRMEMVDPPPLPVPACRDPDDDQILALAIAAKCELIITGDKDLLVLNPFGDVAILTPAQFAATESVE